MAALSDTTVLQPLREAVASGNHDAIRASIPEPPVFLTTVFKLDPDDRDTILRGVFSALDTDEDRWEIIEAAAMDTIVRPERGAFIAVVPYILPDMLDDAQALVQQFPDGSMAHEARKVLAERAARLAVS